MFFNKKQTYKGPFWGEIGNKGVDYTVRSASVQVDGTRPGAFISFAQLKRFGWAIFQDVCAKKAGLLPCYIGYSRVGMVIPREAGRSLITEGRYYFHPLTTLALPPRAARIAGY